MVDKGSVSVIVPVWNGEGTIEATLRSIEDQEYPRELVQVIVVDNGSSDMTRGVVARFGGVLLVEEERTGSYAARNKGLDYATGEYVAFTDADCVADPFWIANAVATLAADESVGILAGHIEVVPDKGGSRLTFLIERETSFKQQEAARRSSCVTANWVSRRAVIEQAGRFDRSLKSGGDWVLSQRISAAGLRVAFGENAVVSHPSRSGVRDLLRKRQRVTGGAWARRQSGIARLIRAELAGCLRRAHKMIRSDALTAGDKMRVMPIVVLMTAVSLGELLRLALGGTPRRA